MFSISISPLKRKTLQKGLANPRAGALVTFEGWVRDHNEGRKVSFLEYEIFEKMAVKEAVKIISEAKKKFKITEIKSVHRAGKLKVGDLAVWIGVTAPHRKDAFKACEYMIGELKVRLPIWKKEYYSNGDSGWVNCKECVSH